MKLVQSGESYKKAMQWLLLVGLWIYGAHLLSSLYQLWKDPTFLPIDHVVITVPDDRIDQEVVKRLVTEQIKGGFFQVDQKSLQKHLMELPWVKNVSLRRIWPSHLSITMTEKQPFARWGKTGILSTEGEVFYPDSKTFPEGIPYLEGPDGSEGILVEQYHVFNQWVAPLHLQVQAVHLTERGTWSIELSNGIPLMLGRRDIPFRVHRFLQWFPSVVGGKENAVERVDLRYANGFVIQWK